MLMTHGHDKAMYWYLDFKVQVFQTALDNHLARSELVHRSSAADAMFSLLLPISYSIRGTVPASTLQG